MNTIVFEFLVIVLLLTCGRVVPRKFQVLTLDDTQITCSRNMACRLAVCLWTPTPTLSEDRCTIFENTCSCPAGRRCHLSDHITPSRNKFVTFEYRCKSPAEILLGVN